MIADIQTILDDALNARITLTVESLAEAASWRFTAYARRRAERKMADGPIPWDDLIIQLKENTDNTWNIIISRPEVLNITKEPN